MRVKSAFLAGFAALAALLGGCATQTASILQGSHPELPPRIELVTTPFFPQERYQCGPAALAMTLAVAGISVTPEDLVSEVYVPAREGSLQVEMLAAGRRNGAFSLTIPPRLEALLAETAAGNPVLVLQNVGLPWFPKWHYSVVIGYDLEHGEIIMRSGTKEREVMPLSTFERTWQRSHSWGMVTLPRDRLPMTAEEETVVAAAVAFEHDNGVIAARPVYAAAAQRWPTNLTLLLGLGNGAYSDGDFAAAAEVFRRAVALQPNSVPALNNLAMTLNTLGHRKEAHSTVLKALALGGSWQNAVCDTLHEIDISPPKSGRQKSTTTQCIQHGSPETSW